MNLLGTLEVAFKHYVTNPATSFVETGSPPSFRELSLPGLDDSPVDQQDVRLRIASTGGDIVAANDDLMLVDSGSGGSGGADMDLEDPNSKQGNTKVNNNKTTKTTEKNKKEKKKKKEEKKKKKTIKKKKKEEEKEEEEEEEEEER